MVTRGTAARLLLVVGALNALLSVAAGAYGAHVFAQHERATIFSTALHYHQFHSLGLIAIGLVATVRPGVLWAWAGVSMIAGIALFSGALYFTAITGQRLGMVAPSGGVAFMAAWALFAIAAWRSQSESR